MQILSDQLKREVKGKVSQFILSEAGRVGYRNAFSMAALVMASSLAAVMLSAHSEAETFNCGDTNCNNFQYCCLAVSDPPVYVCLDEPDPRAVWCYEVLP